MKIYDNNWYLPITKENVDRFFDFKDSDSNPIKCVEMTEDDFDSVKCRMFGTHLQHMQVCTHTDNNLLTITDWLAVLSFILVLIIIFLVSCTFSFTF